MPPSILRRALEQWRAGGMSGPNELSVIEHEPAFAADPSLRSRAEFQAVLDRS
jgi:hypothetical protein